MTPRQPLSATLHTPRHAAAFDFHRNAKAITRARDYQPRHAATDDPRCPRCTAVGASGLLCPPCAGEVATNRAQARDEVTAFHATRGGMNRPDVRVLPLVGPQSPGEAWA